MYLLTVIFAKIIILFKGAAHPRPLQRLLLRRQLRVTLENSLRCMIKDVVQ